MDKINRNHIIFIISLICFVGSIVTVFATMEQRNFHLRGYVNPTQTLDLPYRLPRLGVNVDLIQYAIDDLPAHLDKMEKIGITWVRQLIKDDDFEKWDSITSLFVDRPNLVLIPVLVGTTTDIEQYTAFIADFTTRYSHIIDYYQIWDEPNIQIGWLDNYPNPTHYFALLQSAYRTIHQIDADAYVISAALAPTVETGPQNISDHLYLRQLYQLGLKDYSDAIAGKPYGFDTNPNDRTIRADQLSFSRWIMLREIMLEYGDGQKALWGSNWGWNSLAGEPSIWGQVDVDTQIQHTLDALNRSETEWAWLGGLILENWQADKQNTESQRWGFSLLTPNDQETPLYTALESYHLNHQLTYAQNGLYPANNPYAEYSGVWTFHELGADIGWIQDSQIVFNFYGNSISLITRQDDYVTNLYVTVDDQPANQLPVDLNNNSYLLLKSPQLIPEIVNQPLSQNLPTGYHRLNIVADELIPDEDIPRWSVVGYGVSNHDLASPFYQQITASLFATFVAFVALAISASRIRFSPVFVIWNQFSDVFHVVIAFIASIIVMIGMLITWHDGYPQFFRRDTVQALLGIVTAGLIYWNGFYLPITLILLFFLLLVIYNDIKIGVLLIIFWTPFFLFPVELYRFAFPMVEVMLIVTFGAWLLKTATEIAKSRRLPAIRFDLIDLIVLMWFLSGLVGLWRAEIQHLAVTDFRTLYIQPILFYVIARTVEKDQRFIYQMITTLIVSALIVSGVGLYQLLTGVFIQAEGGSIRLASVYGSPNNAALFLERCLPFVLSFILIGKLEPKIRAIAIFSGIVIVIALVLTLSAGALFIALPAGIVSILLLIYGKRSFKYLIPIAIIFIIGFIFALQSPRFERFLDLTSGTNFYRVRVWQSAVNMIEDNPLTGIGLDQFLYQYRGHYILPDAWQEPELSHPHNIIFDFWLRSGMIGLFFLVSSIGIMIHIIRKTLASNMSKQYLPILIGCVGALVTLITHGLVDNSIFVIDLAYVFSLILILLVSVRPSYTIYTIHQGETSCEF